MEKLKFRLHISFIIYGIILFTFGYGKLFIVTVISAILHEFGHFLISEKLGYNLNTINLMPYGTCLSGSETFIDRKHEIYIALAGPLTSLFIAIICIALWWILPVSYAYTDDFAYSNIALFLVNLLPIFPLDGGRILNAILKGKNSPHTAIKTTKKVSFIFICVLVIMYIITAFYNIQHSLAVFSIFLLTGLFTEESSVYTLHYTTLNQSRLNKGLKVNIKAISDKANILEMYKLLEPNSLNYIIVVDKNNNTQYTLADNEIKNIIFNYPLDMQISSIKEIYKKKIF